MYKKTHIKKTLTLLVLWTLSVTASLTLAAALHNKTLLSNGNWGHILLEIASRQNYALQMLCSRQLLLQNRLTLGDTNYSLQLIYLLKKYNARTISVDMKIPENSWGGIVFNKTPDSISGVVLSRNPYRDSIFFQTNNKLMFTKVTHVNFPPIAVHETFNAKIVFHQNTVQLFINKKPVGTWDHTAPESKTTGLLSGSYSCVFDNFKLYSNTDQQPIFSQNFANIPVSYSVLFAVLITCSALAILSFITLQNTSISQKAKTMITEILLFILLLSVSSPVLLFYNKISIMELLLNPNKSNNKLVAKMIKKLDQNPPLKQIYYNNTADLPGFTHQGKRSADSFNLVVIGDSQTWGDGAITKHPTFVQVAYSLIQKALPNLKLNAHNRSTPGAVPLTQLKNYSKNIKTLKPNVCILNLGFKNNVDLTTGKLKDTIQGFIDVNNTHNVKTVLAIQPVNPEDNLGTEFIKENIISTGLENNVPVWDLNTYIIEKSNRGFIWIDRIHLSPIGHTLAGAYIAHKTMRLMQGEKTTEFTQQKMENYRKY